MAVRMAVWIARRIDRVIIGFLKWFLKVGLKVDL